MADRFPNVSFDWLGNLPAVAQASQDRTTLRETLADLKSTDPDSLEAKAAQLISRGQLQQGLQLQQAALARRTLTQKGASDALQAKLLENFRWPGMGGGGQAQQEQPPNISLTPGGPAAAPPAQDLFQGRPGAIPGVGPRSAVEGGPQMAFNSQPGPAPGPPIPTLPIKPGNTPPIRGPEPYEPFPGIGPGKPGRIGENQPQMQLAGPLPTPDTLPGQIPAPGPQAPQRPAWLQNAQAPAVPAQQAAPEAPFKVPAYQANAQAEADAVGSELAKMPRQLMNSGPGKALLERFRDAMGKLKLDKEQQGWYEERIARQQAKKPDISFQDYKLELAQAPKNLESAEKIYLDHEKSSGQSQQLASTLKRMDAIVNDKNFVSGSSANLYAEGVNKLSSLARIAGIDPAEFQGRLKDITQPHLKAAQLVQEFTSLSNAALMAHVGSFSKSFSDADRRFVENIFPQISQTKEGIQAIMANLREMADYSRGVSKEARNYMKNNPLRATSWGINQAIDDYSNEHPLFARQDGSLTPAGQKILDLQQGGGAKLPPDGTVYQSEKEAWDAYRRGGGT